MPSKGDDLAAVPTPNITNTLAGRLPGLISYNRSGEPGYDDAGLLIRGASTIGNASPLLVVDGVADRAGSLGRLDPNDIESITILKDASAAIYGSRAANGVILVTTKRGSKGDLKVQYTGNVGVSSPTVLPEMCNSWQYAELLNEITPGKYSAEEISETGVSSAYPGSRLSDYEPGKGYTVAFPQKGENNGFGSEFAGIPLPGETPWRTITVGSSLAPIVETTIPYDVVEPLYEASQAYKPSRYTWSWLIWQDSSINYDDQVKMVDVAAAQGYEAVLVDNWWDKQIGRKRIEELSKYAKSKKVSLMLWYNSNGFENDAPQTPRQIMNNSIARKKEMAWMKKIGVVGIKVDFFGGDKQETMKLYEDILSDANDYGLEVIFHGCTMPRGWERMYPNYVSSEAALASENVYFTDYHAKKEAFEMTMHPFSRNAVASFDWGGVMMNRYFSKDNKSRHQRYTSDVFEMATAITNQSSVNCICLYPNNLQDVPQWELDWLKNVPTAWEDTRFIAGYPTKYAVVARKSSVENGSGAALTAGRWFVGGLNATDKPLALTLDLPMFAGKTVTYITDQPKKKGEKFFTSVKKTLKVGKNGKAKVVIQPNGGIIIE